MRIIFEIRSKYVWIDNFHSKITTKLRQGGRWDEILLYFMTNTGVTKTRLFTPNLHRDDQTRLHTCFISEPFITFLWRQKKIIKIRVKMERCLSKIIIIIIHWRRPLSHFIYVNISVNENDNFFFFYVKSFFNSCFFITFLKYK